MPPKIRKNPFVNGHETALISSGNIQADGMFCAHEHPPNQSFSTPFALSSRVT